MDFYATHSLKVFNGSSTLRGGQDRSLTNRFWCHPIKEHFPFTMQELQHPTGCLIFFQAQRVPELPDPISIWVCELLLNHLCKGLRIIAEATAVKEDIEQIGPAASGMKDYTTDLFGGYFVML